MIESDDEEFSIGGRRISSLRHAGDTEITNENKNEMKILAKRVTKEGKDFGMKVNINKYKEHSSEQKIKILKLYIQLDGQEVKQVSKFVY